jgi:hypothetical protein
MCKSMVRFVSVMAHKISNLTIFVLLLTISRSIILGISNYVIMLLS